MSFASLGVSPALVSALAEQKYTKPYPIQEQAIPAILDHKDVLGIAQTGSGKTASYVLPILMNLEGKNTGSGRNINTLVLVPTRELALQVDDVFSSFGASLRYNVKSKAVHGGVSINPQMMSMHNVNVLVATPGRLLELYRAKAVKLDSVDTLVLDEADKMLNLGFKDELDRILSLLPTKRQNLLFSATLSPDIQNIERILLHNPLVIYIAPKELNIDLIQQVAYTVTDERKGPLLRYLIKTKEMKQVLIFTSSIYQADLVADKLKKNGIKARAIHGKKSQGSRNESMITFKNGSLTALVATDLLARGIDIEFLPHVINYELPRGPKDFIHRIGRTGRAENSGEAITFITKEDEHHFKVIQKKMKKQVNRLESDGLKLHGY
ncbi:DEAD/DEAH box helicase [Bacteroidia bacterium]|nr:DEAD/DEAH box helicase [Bacteroidia bacterium]MDC1394875.1 DEAD/DEAH box helicase [Bacteroidia bacterium]